MKLCWLDIRNCGAMTDAVRAEAVHQRIDAIVAADPADLEGLPPTVTKVLMPGAAGLPADLGAADIVIVDANRPQDYAALAARPNGVRVGRYVAVTDPASLELACRCAGTDDWTVLDFRDPTKIPLEIVLALGPSGDRTDEVAAGLSAADPRVRTVRNPTGRTPQGLNLAIGASRHAVVARVDGHAQLPTDYLRTAVELLERTEADNVGGLMWAEGVTDVEKAIARAMTSKLGVGNARFHVGGEEGPAETVYLGVFRRTALDRVGGYDEVFARAQDWEMNYRIRSTGGLVWFSPLLRVTYRPRPSLGEGCPRRPSRTRPRTTVPASERG